MTELSKEFDMPKRTRFRGEYMREYQNKWVQSRRQEWIESQGGVCAQCGSDDRLEVDHIDPTQKLTNPRNIWSRNAGFRAMELAKCQVLCNACHIEKTRAQFARPCGTKACYERGCRCRPCKDAAAADKREYRARRKARESALKG